MFGRVKHAAQRHLDSGSFRDAPAGPGQDHHRPVDDLVGLPPRLGPDPAFGRSLGDHALQLPVGGVRRRTSRGPGRRTAGRARATRPRRRWSGSSVRWTPRESCRRICVGNWQSTPAPRTCWGWPAARRRSDAWLPAATTPNPGSSRNRVPAGPRAVRACGYNRMSLGSWDHGPRRSMRRWSGRRHHQVPGTQRAPRETADRLGWTRRPQEGRPGLRAGVQRHLDQGRVRQGAEARDGPPPGGLKAEGGLVAAHGGKVCGVARPAAVGRASELPALASEARARPPRPPARHLDRASRTIYCPRVPGRSQVITFPSFRGTSPRSRILASGVIRTLGPAISSTPALCWTPPPVSTAPNPSRLSVQRPSPHPLLGAILAGLVTWSENRNFHTWEVTSFVATIRTVPEWIPVDALTATIPRQYPDPLPAVDKDLVTEPDEARRLAPQALRAADTPPATI
ncbi:hypothetical protein BN6_20900 [Saccharothrix espanaensis DSM 44229]|uniref:Uncharacterized protein n=1 Tax=Saccharothrix espanaensis (strain ATCC 51144 / DSM 44229 / JCM 9112 / NBRC 15066 / NRRL 15764) TaxID=1179773 RepID=K0JQ46_SACES|nr:hypothetical protein BN6_20900 [Saccharothrix espanaensis DSM 44229]